jgi:hypothetical protein
MCHGFVAANLQCTMTLIVHLTMIGQPAPVGQHTSNLGSNFVAFGTWSKGNCGAKRQAASYSIVSPN